MRGCFVTGTDTGVGKTVLSAAIVASLRARGRGVTALKPVITGLDDPPDPRWPPDHELLARVAGVTSDEVILAGYGPPVSPHLAVELSGVELEFERLVAGIRERVEPGCTMVVEGVGGLLVPLDATHDVRDLAAALGLALVIAARPGLGTINHSLLTLEAARRAGIEPAGLVLTPWPAQPGTIERSNLETIERRGGVEVATLPEIASPTPELLADAAAGLPLERWLQ